MELPEGVQTILNTLTAAGFEAYGVGGCVRDSLLGRVPQDWDICTSALPEETKNCFSGCRVLDTGLQHGTVTVLLGKTPYEITTFRQDGAYVDHRKPSQVQFVSTLPQDLSRRDFTIGAMAVDREGNIVDLFDGQGDLRRQCIRCVGEPEQRFEEDALRILRGLRFASQLNFRIHPDTARAMEEKKMLLRYVSGERIYGELTRLLMGEGAATVLQQYGSVLTAVLPELQPAMGFLQHHPCHHKDVWGHTVEALSYAPPNSYVRWALLLHDLGKPDCFSLGEDGVGHFYGHPDRGAVLAEHILKRLRADKKTRDTVCMLVKYHDYQTPVTEKYARRCLMKFGVEPLKLLLEVKGCDALAHANTPKAQARYAALLQMKVLVQDAIASNACVTVQALNISGTDLLELGIPKGPKVGEVLNRLLLDVVDGRCENDKSMLLPQARAYGDILQGEEREGHDR